MTAPERPDTGRGEDAGREAGWSGALRRLGPESLLFGALALLSLVGIGVSDFSARYGLRYWLWMVPVFAATSIWTGWARERRRGEGGARILREQVLHWLPLPVAIYLVHQLQTSGRLNQEDAGLVALLALALTTLLAGVHFDWRLAVLGGLLALTAAAAAFMEEYFWLLLIPALLAVVVVVYWHRKEE